MSIRNNDEKARDIVLVLLGNNYEKERDIARVLLENDCEKAQGITRALFKNNYEKARDIALVLLEDDTGVGYTEVHLAVHSIRRFVPLTDPQTRELYTDIVDRCRVDCES